MTSLNHFERLGLPRRFAFDPTEIEQQYLLRSKEIHPDFHQMGSTLEQQASVELSAALNEAYATLREPFRRAEYLLQLEGGPSAAEWKDVPAEFLEEMLELRMHIEELKEQGSDSPALQKLEESLQDRKNILLQQVESLFAKQQAAPTHANLQQIRRLLNAIKYLQNLLRDLR